MIIDMADNLKIVIDSNVIISSLVFGGKPKEVIKKVLLKEIGVYTSIQLVSELVDVLRKRFGFSEEKIKKLENEVLVNFETVYPSKTFVVVRDIADNKVIEVSEEAGCDFIVTGDKDLLVLEQYEKCKIVTPSEFLEIIEEFG